MGLEEAALLLFTGPLSRVQSWNDTASAVSSFPVSPLHFLETPGVEDEVACELDSLVVESVEGEDLGGVDDRHIEPCLDRVMEEHRVHHLARQRREAERAVAQSEHGTGPRHQALDLSYRVQRVDPAVAQFLLAGAEREGEGVEDQVLFTQAMDVDRVISDAPADRDLSLERHRLSLLVDRQGDDRGAEPFRQPEDRIRLLGPILEVDGVDDGAAAAELQGGLQHRDLRRIDAERERHLCVEPADHFDHVARLVAADVRHADIEDMSSLLHLLLGHGDHRIVILLRQQITELL